MFLYHSTRFSTLLQPIKYQENICIFLANILSTHGIQGRILAANMEYRISMHGVQGRTLAANTEYTLSMHGIQGRILAANMEYRLSNARCIGRT